VSPLVEEVMPCTTGKELDLGPILACGTRNSTAVGVIRFERTADDHAQEVWAVALSTKRAINSSHNVKRRGICTYRF
jgi:hypothetical protein